MASITLRSSLSRGLTNSEVDDNFTNLNNDKAENGANSDITSMSGVTGEIGDPTQIQFNVQASHPAYSEGLLWYDNIHNTLNYYGDESGLVHEIGIEEHQKVYNNSGVTINKGEPLYFSGNFNGYPTAAKANATDVNKYNAQGIAAHSIENGTYGYVCTAGLVEDVDTSGLSSGTNFFVGLTDGAVQNASPTYPNFPMCLGWVVNSDATNGILLVNQQNHSVNSFRVRTDTHIGGDLIIDGNLTVVGEQTSVGQTNVTQGAPFLRLNEGNAIGESGTTFTGSGLDDAFFSGHFTGTAAQTYYVRIDSVGGGTGGVDTFEVAVGTDSTFQNPILTGVDITGDPQLIHSTDNISVEFGSTTGHTLNDSWSGTASPIDADTGIWTNRNTGTTGVGYTHMGMYFDVSDAKFRLVDEYDPVPTGTINTLDNSYSAGTLIVDGLEATSATVGGNAVLTTASSNINADTVDGLEASQFLRSDANDGTSSQITLYGTTPFLFAPTAQGMSYNATENGGTANSRYFLRFDRTNNASYPYLTNRTPSGDVAVFTGGATAGTENEIIRFKGGNGTRAIELTNSYFDMGTNDITDTKVGQWDTAYGWGDHASAGYLTSYTETDTLDSVVGRGASTSSDISVGNITTSGQINLPNDHFVNRQFQLDAVDTYGVVYVLLCRNAPNNDVNGTISMDRTSGLRHACQVDIVVSSGSSNNPIGSLRAHGVAGAGQPDYKLVTVTYNSDNNSYVALKITNPDSYHETSGAYFTGRIVNSYSNTLTAVNSTQVSNESSLYVGASRHSFDGDIHLGGGITLSGTVDGRDVATDGTKLDGIESGATADQTASEILTAIKTVDGAGSGLDADLLDGNDASAFVSASGDTMTGDLTGTQATTSASWTVLERFFANPAAESGEQTDIRLINDLAGFNKWGTETLTDIVTSHQGSTALTTLGDNAFDGSSSTRRLYQNANGDPNVILLELPHALTYSCWVGIVFGATQWRTKSVKIETFRNGAWQTECDLTNQSSHIVARQVSGNNGNGVTKIRYTLDDYQNTGGSYARIHSLFAVNYNAGNNAEGGVHYLSRFKDDEHYSNIAPATDSTYALGTTSKRYSNVYSDALNVAGNISVTGTVDGRDVAADGTKLDGIESNATADQTASEIRTLVESATDSNVFTDADHTKLNGIETGATADQTASEILTAIKTVDGSGSGLDADTVDGIEASSFLRSDATDTATGALTFGNILTLNGSQTGGYPLIRLTSGSSSFSRIQFGTTADVDEGIIQYDPTQNHFDFTVGAVNRFRMEGDGDFHADGDVIAYSTTISDRRLKTNIKNIDDAVEKVKQLNGCTFNRHDGQASAGVIAQDVEAVLPEAIREKELPLHLANDTTTYKLVEYDAIIGLLVESVKELTARVEELENAASDNR